MIKNIFKTIWNYCSKLVIYSKENYESKKYDSQEFRGFTQKEYDSFTKISKANDRFSD